MLGALIHNFVEKFKSACTKKTGLFMNQSDKVCRKMVNNRFFSKSTFKMVHNVVKNCAMMQQIAKEDNVIGM